MKLAIATIARKEDLTAKWLEYREEQDSLLRAFNLDFERFDLMDKPIAEARQKITEIILDRKEFTHMLFIDSDTFIPAHKIFGLVDLAHDFEVMCYPVYLKRMPLITNIYPDMAFMPLIKLPRKIFQIELTGLAACIIDLRVFDKIDKPWYKGKWKVRVGDVDFRFSAGEDTAFFYKLKRAGVKVYCNPKYIPSHYDKMNDIFYPDLIKDKERCYNGY